MVGRDAFAEDLVLVSSIHTGAYSCLSLLQGIWYSLLFSLGTRLIRGAYIYTHTKYSDT